MTFQLFQLVVVRNRHMNILIPLEVVHDEATVHQIIDNCRVDNVEGGRCYILVGIFDH